MERIGTVEEMRFPGPAGSWIVKIDGVEHLTWADLLEIPRPFVGTRVRFQYTDGPTRLSVNQTDDRPRALCFEPAPPVPGPEWEPVPNPAPPPRIVDLREFAPGDRGEGKLASAARLVEAARSWTDFRAARLAAEVASAWAERGEVMACAEPQRRAARIQRAAHRILEAPMGLDEATERLDVVLLGEWAVANEDMGEVAQVGCATWRRVEIPHVTGSGVPPEVRQILRELEDGHMDRVWAYRLER